MKRVHALDGLRAVAATLVLGHHLLTNAYGNGLISRAMSSLTQSGVELFFVLSGVVLARKYIRDGAALPIGQYLARRIQRLWPPFLAAWVLAGIVVGLRTMWPTWWSETAYLPSFEWLDWLSQVLIVNWWTTLYNFAWWSLSVEVAFYLVLPFLIQFFARFHRSTPAMAAVLICSAAASLWAFLSPFGVTPLAGSLLSYSVCFVGGLVLAAVDLKPIIRWVVMGTGVCALLFWLAVPTAGSPHLGWGLIYIGVVALATDSRTLLHRALSADVLVWLGERSYSLFLTHVSVITATSWAVSLAVPGKGFFYFVATRLIEIPAAFLVAMLLFWFIERRFANGLMTADRFWPWRYGMPTRLNATDLIRR